jgi:hypothetical protein
MTEAEMVDNVLRKLRQKNIKVYKEIGFLSRSLDLVIHEADDTFTVIEFKRNDWKRGLKQVKTALLGAEKVYICTLPVRNISERMIKEFKNSKAGLFFYDTKLSFPLEEKIPARNSRLAHPIFKEWLRQAFEDRMDK